MSAVEAWVACGMLEAAISCSTGAWIVEIGFPIVGTGLSIVLGTAVARPADIDFLVDPMMRKIKPTKAVNAPAAIKPKAVICSAAMAPKLNGSRSMKPDMSWPNLIAPMMSKTAPTGKMMAPMICIFRAAPGETDIVAIPPP